MSVLSLEVQNPKVSITNSETPCTAALNMSLYFDNFKDLFGHTYALTRFVKSMYIFNLSFRCFRRIQKKAQIQKTSFPSIVQTIGTPKIVWRVLLF